MSQIPPPTASGGIFENGLSKDHEILRTYPGQSARYDVSGSCFRSAFVEVRKTAENAASVRFVCIKSNAVSRRVQIFRVKNIGEVFELNGVAFRLAPPYGGLLAIKLGSRLVD